MVFILRLVDFSSRVTAPETTRKIWYFFLLLLHLHVAFQSKQCKRNLDSNIKHDHVLNLKNSIYTSETKKKPEPDWVVQVKGRI